MAFVSITRLRIRSWRHLLPFFIDTSRIIRQAKRAEGVVAVSVLPDAARTFWTRTVWVDEAAMKAFLLAGAHGKSMRRLMEWCDEAAVVHWEQDSQQEPDWREAHRRLQGEGRRSKVKWPSATHERFEIRAPKLSR